MADMEGAPGTGGRAQDAAARRRGPRRLDLTGQKFGRLTALEPAKDIGGQTAWLCKCDCGGETVVRTANLRSGRTRSCGCLRRDRRENLTGRRFGRLTVLGWVDGNRPGWRCRCDCGNETVVQADSLRSGRTRSCGCLRGPRRLDLAGRKFGHLTALEPAGNVNGQTAWLCRCDCGREAIVRTNYLTFGHVKHCSDPECSCTKRNQRDLTGRRFGHLTVTGPDPDRSSRCRSFWRCRCDCGRETVARTGNLNSGKVSCCGHPDCPHSPKRREALAGRTYGWLTALERVEDVDGMPAWRCRCRCGNEVTVEASKLRQGNARDCGCRKAAGGRSAPDAARAGAD